MPGQWPTVAHSSAARSKESKKMTQQLRLWLTLSAVEDEEINRAYAEYLLGSDEHKSRNQWLKDMIMENIRRN